MVGAAVFGDRRVSARTSKRRGWLRTGVMSFKGWAQLRPLSDYQDETGILVRFVFPLNLENRYEISDKNKDEASLLLPHNVSEDGAQQSHIEAALMVDKNGQVFLERGAGTNAQVSVNGEVVQAGNTWRVPLQYGSTVSFGVWKFLFKHCEGLFSGGLLKGMAEMERCHLCMGRKENVQILACGHNVCSSCSEKAKSQQTTVHRHAHGGRLNRFVRVMQCNACHSRVTPAIANNSIFSNTANQVSKVFGQVEEVESNRPLCAGCGNERGLVSSRDYEFCQQCKQMLCPACILQWHRDHLLKPRTDRCRDLDQVKCKLEAAKREMNEIEEMQRNIKTELEDEGSLCGHVANAIARNLDSLDQTVKGASEQLRCILLRKRELANGWDQESRAMETIFKRRIQQCRELCQRIDRVKNENASLTVESIAEENEKENGSTASSGTPSSSDK